ncbi:MAG: hypothetical protein ACPGVB_07330 [Chitinophagales bacterium]
MVSKVLQLGKHQWRIEVGDLAKDICRLKVGREMVSRQFLVN